VSAEVRVSYFAAARELCGTQSELVPMESPRTVRAFMTLLAARHARLAPYLPRMRLAVNGEIVDAEHSIAGGDEVAVLPPVAGGSGGAPAANPTVTLCALRDVALSVDEVLQALRRPDAGGIALFIGVVRDHANGKPVARLDYEAHAALALRELRSVLDEVASAIPGTRLAVLHRTGQLAIGDMAVVVGASAPHRAEAFDACRRAIEQLKLRVPIWKKEWAPDGSANWVNLDD
jgi:molybdopterin synthase catalytic subunit